MHEWMRHLMCDIHILVLFYSCRCWCAKTFMPVYILKAAFEVPKAFADSPNKGVVSLLGRFGLPGWC